MVAVVAWKEQVLAHRMEAVHRELVAETGDSEDSEGMVVEA